MTRREIANRLDVNFDGLTDSVTNLVGALILLVLLLLGVTTKAVHPTAAAPSAGTSRAGQHSAADLLESVVVIQAQIGGIQQQVATTARQLDEVRESVAALVETVEGGSD